jgi:hypothetical protein
MAIVRKDTLNISGGVSNKGEPRLVSYPIEVHDNSGLDNNHIFTGEIPNVASGNAPQAQPSSPPDTVDYAQANHTPQGMNEPKPPRGKGV